MSDIIPPFGEASVGSSPFRSPIVRLHLQQDRGRTNTCRQDLAAHTSSVASCAASTVSNQPTVVMGERPGGLKTEVGDPAIAVAGDSASDLRVPRA
jgi:hypothetical protein